MSSPAPSSPKAAPASPKVAASPKAAPASPKATPAKRALEESEDKPVSSAKKAKADELYTLNFNKALDKVKKQCSVTRWNLCV